MSKRKEYQTESKLMYVFSVYRMWMGRTMSRFAILRS